MHNRYDVIVVGGGAAGMFAAIHVGLGGRRVLLLERNDRLGKKLRITGKGRCNVTNCATAEEVLQNIPRNGKFLYSALTRYPPEKLMKFLEAEGCPLKTERGNRVFPVSDRSASVLQALERALERSGAAVQQGRVTEICTEAGHVSGVRTETQVYGAEKVILATGGCSYPATGSTGDGYRLAARLGHTIIPPTGSLVPLEELGTDCRQMQGLSLRNVAVRLYHDGGKCLYRDFGELLFTHFGLSGPTVLSASAHMGKSGSYRLVIDLKPALDEEKLDAKNPAGPGAISEPVYGPRSDGFAAQVYDSGGFAAGADSGKFACPFPDAPAAAQSGSGIEGLCSIDFRKAPGRGGHRDLRRHQDWRSGSQDDGLQAAAGTLFCGRDFGL